MACGCLLFLMLGVQADARRPSQRLTDIRYLSKRAYTRVVLLVRGRISGINHDYIPVRRGFPARIYVDLTPCIPLRRWSRVPHRIGDRHVSRIRVARNTRRTTRVVFELKMASRYRVKILRRPLRIVVDIGRRKLPKSGLRKLPRLRPQPWRRSRRTRRPRRRYRWRGSKHKHSKGLAIRHKGPLPQISFPFRVKRIAIDAGHGGRENGAIGRTGLKEKVLTLDIAKRVIRLIRRRRQQLGGVKAFMLRKKDRLVSLSQRAWLARQKNADLLISIHVNAHTNRKIHGISTYILNWSSRSFAAQLLSSDPLTARENQGVHPKRFSTVKSIVASLKRQSNLGVSKILAIALQRGMLRSVRKKHKWIKDLGVRRGLFYLLFAVADIMPSVLVEASYVSNKREEKLLRTKAYRQKVAVGIVDGLSRFLVQARRSLKKKKKKSARR